MTPPSVSAVLLAAGYGTRLYPLTKDCPKALLPLGDATILDPIVELVANVPGLSKTILVTNHRFAKQFRAWKPRRPFALDVVDDQTATPESRLGAIRDLLLAIERIDPKDDLLVVGTDNLFAWSLKDFVASARAKRPAPTIAVGRAPSVEIARQSGVVEVDASDRVTRFLEKPADPPALTIAYCVYYFPAPMRARLLEFIQTGGNVDAPGYLIAWLLTQEAVYAFEARGEWFDIGSLEAYRHAGEWWSRSPLSHASSPLITGG